MESVSVKSLETKFKGEGAERFAKIAELGGFGTVGTGEGGLDPGSTLDLTGVLDEENKGVKPEAKAKIRELAGSKDAKNDGTK